ncbi:MAG: hypothetical protein WDO24_08695 [Pseudomonadota bacterium]
MAAMGTHQPQAMERRRMTWLPAQRDPIEALGLIELALLVRLRRRLERRPDGLPPDRLPAGPAGRRSGSARRRRHYLRPSVWGAGLPQAMPRTIFRTIISIDA